ncbi:MAG: 4-hydroxyphenylpyruvate dioxygenase [Sandaracinaceae bacterium]|nr:4-hydroxyphenylpyruvate dioxygenase [Sandaracinaceae bacterium]
MTTETMTETRTNPLRMKGIAFVEWSAPSQEGLQSLHRLFLGLGFSRLMRHRDRDVDLYRQNDILFVLDKDEGSFARSFADAHGPCISGLGLAVEDAQAASGAAAARGATAPGRPTLYRSPALVGIGGMQLHLVEVGERPVFMQDFLPLESPDRVPDRGFLAIDHLTNNVPKGTLAEYRRFYREVFGFTDVRTFDIRGQSTGLTSYALRSPCGTFCLPINEGSEEKSQIEEYLREYRGPGVQHLALSTRDLLRSLEGLTIPTLDIDPAYYETVFERVPNVREDKAAIRDHAVLVDGDEQGYLLQIFTQNVAGPIFFEMIQRENHQSFGEGNFSALFRSIERDQERRGVI